MRIVSWNCYRGECRRRAARLAELHPDLAVLQECGDDRPDDTDKQDKRDNKCVWFGSRTTKGVGIVARGEWSVEPGPIDSAVAHSVYPVRVHGPVDFHLIAIWAQRCPTYVRAILSGLARYRDFMTAAPERLVVVGDFNSHQRWDADDLEANHSTLTKLLRNDFGLVSAYHNKPGRSGSAPEEPTLYWRWHQSQPFHIDYCFIPDRWLPRLGAVEVGGYQQWAKESDHRPLTVEVRIEGTPELGGRFGSA